MFLYKGPCSGVCLLRHTGRIGTQIGDQANRSMPLNFHTFVQLLRQPHCLLRRKIEGLGSFLLHGTGGKWNRRFFNALSLFYFIHCIGYSLQILHNLIQFRLAADHRLSLCLLFFLAHSAVIPGRKVFFHTGQFKRSIQVPVFLRNKCIDLILAVTDHAQGYRLHAAGAQPPLYLCPQKRADAVPYHTVQHTAGLLGIDQIQIQRPGGL